MPLRWAYRNKKISKSPLFSQAIIPGLSKAFGVGRQIFFVGAYKKSKLSSKNMAFGQHYFVYFHIFPENACFNLIHLRHGHPRVTVACQSDSALFALGLNLAKSTPLAA
jgi:hypothetical protein